jgi:hypothetical protein
MKILIILSTCFVAIFADYVSFEETVQAKSLWDQVKHDEVEILYFVFKMNPEIQARFPAFVGKDLDSLKESAAFATHAARIISFVSEIYQLLGKEETRPAIKTVSLEFSINHKKRGIPVELLKKFKDSTIDFMRIKLKLSDAEYNLVQKSSAEPFQVVLDFYDGKY